MTEADKSRMLAALLEGIPQGTTRRQLEKLCAAELKTLEPIFDEILLRELTTLAKFMVFCMTGFPGGKRVP